MVRRGDALDLGNAGSTEKRIGYADTVANDEANGNGYVLALAPPTEGPARK